MIIITDNTNILSYLKLTPSSEEVNRVEDINGGILVDDFIFDKDIELYEYIDGEIVLKSNWEELSVEPILTFEDAKLLAIDKLHQTYQDGYNAYLAQYPQAEVESFPTKQKEAEAYELDNTALTPRISDIVQGDEAKRIELINAILAKVKYLAEQEGVMVATRDAIKACETIEELEALGF